MRRIERLRENDLDRIVRRVIREDNKQTPKVGDTDTLKKLQTYLKGYDRSFPICRQQCGKIISSREKIEENLLTGEKTIFQAGQEK